LLSVGEFVSFESDGAGHYPVAVDRATEFRMEDVTFGTVDAGEHVMYALPEFPPPDIWIFYGITCRNQRQVNYRRIFASACTYFYSEDLTVEDASGGDLFGFFGNGQMNVPIFRRLKTNAVTVDLTMGLFYGLFDNLHFVLEGAVLKNTPNRRADMVYSTYFESTQFIVDDGTDWAGVEINGGVSVID
jgi:hypothetical protein